MSAQPYSDKKWVYPTPEDYGLGDTDTGANDIPLFMIRMMLAIRDSLPGDDYDKYKYAFRKAADHFYKKGFINLMNGRVERVRDGDRYELESRRKTHDKGGSAVTDAPEKMRRFSFWVITASRIKQSRTEQKA